MFGSRLFESRSEQLERLLQDPGLRNHILYNNSNGSVVRVGELLDILERQTEVSQELGKLQEQLHHARSEARYYQVRYDALEAEPPQKTPEDFWMKSLINKIQELRDAGRGELAQEYVGFILERDPHNPHGHYLAGTLYEREGKLPEALQEYETVLKMGKHSSAQQGWERVQERMKRKKEE